MRLKNIGSATLQVAGLGIAPGRVGEVGDHAYQAWLERAPVNRATAARLRRLPDDPLVVAVRSCRTLTREGKPDCRALGRIVGRPVSAGERDEAVTRAAA